MKAQTSVSGIYVVLDESASKAYVGATNDKVSRFSNHCKDLQANRHHNVGLQKAFNNGHKLNVLFVPVENGVDPFKLENELIDEFRPTGVLYNSVRGAGDKGHRPESIEKMRSAKLGKVLTPEHRAAISASNVGKNLGKKRTPEQIEVYKQLRLQQARAVVVCGTEYPSVSDAARAHGITPGTASSRCRTTTQQFSDWNFKS